jgi:hypothetical protein
MDFRSMRAHDRRIFRRGNREIAWLDSPVQVALVSGDLSHLLIEMQVRTMPWKFHVLRPERDSTLG